jgi:hypothetical protein
MPFTFILLDELHTIKGFNEASEKSIYSNEVKDLKNQKLNVRMGKETIELGLYDEIKDAVKVKGGKYSKSCYIAYFDENRLLRIGNIMMTGSSLAGGKYKDENKNEIEIGGWMDFVSKNKNEVYKKAIVVTLEERVCVKGANKYRVPKFTLKEISEETNKKANLLDIELQDYLKAYFHKQSTNTEVVEDLITQETEREIKSSDPHIYGEARTKEDIQQSNNPGHIGNDDLPF